MNSDEQPLSAVRSLLPSVPASPGVYLWFGEALDTTDTVVLYVGKAIHLRNRLRSYLSAADLKTRHLMRRVKRFEWIVTNTELEALLLENNLIKKHIPPFNIRLKDDKRYPYLCLTMSETFPRLILTRKRNDPRNLYYGPYSDVRAARITMETVHKAFPIRKRQLKLPTKKPLDPCLNYHIKRCFAPCAHKITPEEYAPIVEDVRAFLEGRSTDLTDMLERRMLDASQQMAYERAATYRDILNDIRTAQRAQSVETAGDSSFDVIGIDLQSTTDLAAELPGTGYSGEHTTLSQVVVLKIRNGKLVNKSVYALTEAEQDAITEEEDVRVAVLESFLRGHYVALRDLPPRIVLPFRFASAKSWESLLSESTGSPVQLESVTPETEGLSRMASENARLTLRERFFAENLRSRKLGLKQIQTFLRLRKLPERIECYDISNIQGTNAVGSGVMLRDGAPHKPGYRRYRIRTVEGANDPAMMYEVLSRRFRRIASGIETEPDLIVIDGGSTQLNAAIRARDEAGFATAMVGLAKKLEEIYFPDGRVIRFDTDSPGMQLLRLARDEAHRFGVAYHRNLRMRGALESWLDAIPGIGGERRVKLMNLLRRTDIGKTDRKSLDKAIAAIKIPRQAREAVLSKIYNGDREEDPPGLSDIRMSDQK